MKAFLASIAATIVIAVAAWAVFSNINTSVDEVPTVASVRLN
jgi:hypothetical protein